MTLAATGDLDVDQHLASGTSASRSAKQCSQALSNRRGINRAGYFVQITPTMDGALAVAAIDLGGTARIDRLEAEGAESQNLRSSS